MLIAFVRPMAGRNRYIQNVPLNYVHLAAYVRERGHEAKVLDMIFDDVTADVVDDFIRDHHVRLVGIGCMTCEFPEAVEEARRIKSTHPGVKVVFGGAHPSADPEECLKTGVVDYVIVGEGETALAQLLDALEEGKEPGMIQGLWLRHGDQIQTNIPAKVPDIESLPRPAYDILDLEKYFKLDSPWHFPKSSRAVQFISSRGCPYHCSYCHTIHGKKYRGLSPSRVLDDMEYLVRTFGVKEFMMVDDIFNFDLERAKEICRGIIARRLNVSIQFPNGVRGDRFDEELVSLMKQAGTHYMAIAIETVSDRYQRLIRKNLKIDSALQTIHWVRKYNMEVCGFFMIGFPGETLEDVNRTIDFAVNAPLDTIFISLVSPYKGTMLRNDMLENRFGELDAEAYAQLDQLFPTVHNDALPVELLKKIQRDAYFRFYIKPRPLLNLTKKLTNGRNVKKVVRAVKRRVFEKEIASLN